MAHDPTGSSPAADRALRTVRAELRAYSESLAKKPEIVVLSKCDLPGFEESLNLLVPASDSEVTAISAVTGEGVGALLRRIARALSPDGEAAPERP